MNNVLNISDINEKCTGCSACCNVCPTQSISMEINSEGFLYPIIKNSKCIDCGKCISACQICNLSSKVYPLKVLTGFAVDEAKRKSGSSGGVVGLMSDRIIMQNGAVYGAVFNASEKKVIHASSDDYSLESLSKSKYVQSEIGSTFKEVRINLEKGRKVLFCGTPCQIKGLLLFLNKVYDNLITVDFVCHGVPSAGLFGNLIEYYEQTEKCNVIDISFREKDLGWRKQITKIYLSNGNIFSKKSLDSFYYFFFLKNYSLRKSCYNCELYCEHSSDITVADYWQVEKQTDDDKGVSLICINTKNGLDFFNQIKADISILTENDSIDLSRYNHNYPTDLREKFFDCYLNKGFDYIKNDFFNKEKAAYNRKQSITHFHDVASRVKAIFK